MFKETLAVSFVCEHDHSLFSDKSTQNNNICMKNMAQDDS